MGARSIHKATAATAGGVDEATIVAIDADGVSVRPEGDAAPAEVLRARVLATAGFRPCVGDRVVVAHGPRGAYVVGAVACAAPETRTEPAVLLLADGARAAIEGGSLALRDEGGRLLMRYTDGALEVSAPTADLTLTAPRGRVVIEAATDVAIAAARDLVHHAGRRIDLGVGAVDAAPRVRVEPERTHVVADRLAVDANEGRLAVGEGTIIARAIATTAEVIATNVGRYELTATTLVEQAREAVRGVEGLLEQRIGRARVFVKETFAMTSRRTQLESDEDTTIDGKKILIG